MRQEKEEAARPHPVSRRLCSQVVLLVQPEESTQKRREIKPTFGMPGREVYQYLFKKKTKTGIA